MSPLWVAAQWSGPWPRPVLWLAGAHGQPAEALHATGADRFLALADPAQDAVAQQLPDPPRRRERLILAPVPTAPGHARRFTTEVLAIWALPGLTDEATLIVSELVTNGIQHADTDLELRLEHRRGLLHIAIRDSGSGNTAHPAKNAAEEGRRSGAAAAIPEHGRGLKIVQALAAACGRTSVPGGGSVYWATLRAG